MSMFSKVLRAGEGKKVRRLAELVPLVNALEPEMEARSDEELQAMTVEFRRRPVGGHRKTGSQPGPGPPFGSPGRRAAWSGGPHLPVQRLGGGHPVAGLRTADDATLGPLDLMLQLFDYEIDGNQRDLSRGLRPDGLAVAGHHHLAALTVGDPRVALFREVDFGTIETGTVLADVAHLLLGQGSNLVGHDLPAMRDDYVHSFASSASVIDSYCTGWPVLLVGR